VKRKGTYFRFARHLTFRTHHREDFDSDEAYERNKQYVVIVSRKTGKVLPREGWSRTNMMCGAWRKTFDYWTKATYWCEDACVYRHVQTSYEDPERRTA